MNTRPIPTARLGEAARRRAKELRDQAIDDLWRAIVRHVHAKWSKEPKARSTGRPAASSTRRPGACTI